MAHKPLAMTKIAQEMGERNSAKRPQPMPNWLVGPKPVGPTSQLDWDHQLDEANLSGFSWGFFLDSKPTFCGVLGNDLGVYYHHFYPITLAKHPFTKPHK